MALWQSLELYSEDSYPDAIFVPKPPPGDLHCSICLNVPKQPKRCNNDHLFCNSCIREWLERGNETCPVDRDTLAMDTLSTARMAANLIAEYCITCTSFKEPEQPRKIRKTTTKSSSRRDGGCFWVGKVNDLENHLSTCSYFEVECTWAGCNFRTERRDLPAHVELCVCRVVNCELCNEVVMFRLMEIHQDMCPSRPFSCPTAGCNATFPFHELRQHREACQYLELVCPYKQSIGCQHRCLRRDMAAHSSDASVHLTCVIGKLVALEQRNADLEVKNRILKTTISSQQRDISTIISQISGLTALQLKI
jgi:hypothetical protein